MLLGASLMTLAEEEEEDDDDDDDERAPASSPPPPSPLTWYRQRRHGDVGGASPVHSTYSPSPRCMSKMRDRTDAAARAAIPDPQKLDVAEAPARCPGGRCSTLSALLTCSACSCCPDRKVDVPTMVPYTVTSRSWPAAGRLDAFEAFEASQSPHHHLRHHPHVHSLYRESAAFAGAVPTAKPHAR